MSMSTPGAASRLSSIQALRGLAALLVVLGHAQEEATQMTNGAFQRLPGPWGSGVDIFFLISGFIMIYSTRNDYGSWASAGRFIKRRIQRVVPPYYFFTIAMAIATLLVPEQLDTAQFSWEALVGSLLFLPVTNAEGSIRPILSLGWTLNYEMFFYLIFAICLPFSRRAAVSWTLFALALIVLLGAVFKIDSAAWTFYTNPLLLEFGLGVALGVLFVQKDRATGVNWLPATAVIVALLAWSYKEDPQLMHRVATLGAMSTILLAIALWQPPSMSPTTERVTGLLGDASYSLYLSHPFALAIWKLVWRLPETAFFNWLYVLTASLFAIACAVAFYFIVEKPLIRFFAREPAPSSPPKGA